MEAGEKASELIVEHRRFPRLKFTVPVQYRNILKPQEPFAGSLSKDLSAGGVKVTTFHFLGKDLRLVLLLYLPSSLKPIRAIGRVAWMQKQRYTESYDCGIQFLEVNSEDQAAVADTVERGVVQRS